MFDSLMLLPNTTSEMIEQRAVAVTRLLQPLQQIREHRHVQLVDLDEFVQPLAAIRN